MAAFGTTRTNYDPLTLAGRIGSTLTMLVGGVSAWNDARLTRNALNRLSDRELDDIGLVRGDIDMIARGKHLR